MRAGPPPGTPALGARVWSRWGSGFMWESHAGRGVSRLCVAVQRGPRLVTHRGQTSHPLEAGSPTWRHGQLGAAGAVVPAGQECPSQRPRGMAAAGSGGSGEAAECGPSSMGASRPSVWALVTQAPKATSCLMLDVESRCLGLEETPHTRAGRGDPRLVWTAQEAERGSVALCVAQRWMCNWDGPLHLAGHPSRGLAPRPSWTLLSEGQRPATGVCPLQLVCGGRLHTCACGRRRQHEARGLGRAGGGCAWCWRRS